MTSCYPSFELESLSSVEWRPLLCVFHVPVYFRPLSIAIEPQREVGGLEVVLLSFFASHLVCVRHFDEVPVYRATHTQEAPFSGRWETDQSSY